MRKLLEQGYERYYGSFNATANKDFLSPRDPDGHGSHTASTAVGRRVNRVSALGGYAMGSALGGAPLARLAVYKACWAYPNQEKVFGNVCLGEDMLAAFDDAIADGVHVISISVGSFDRLPYSQDGIAIGALHAVKRNVVVVASAGNYGPTPGTLSNPAPWLITVGASSLDRDFIGGLVLGNGYTVETESITALKMNKFAPLVYAGDVSVPGIALNNTYTAQCLRNSLKPELVNGKVVLCLRGAGTSIGKGLEVKRAGGVGMILGNSAVPYSHFVATASVTPTVVEKVLDYIKTGKNPTAFIIPGKTVYKYQPAPSMAGFSSRGPNLVDLNILKNKPKRCQPPDITAPGLNILAAWSGADSPSKVSIDHRVADYNFDSGTSMSCPHVSGAIALLKVIHPKWSSAALRSALMTTAFMTNDEKKPIQDTNGLPANPFALGSGHFRPTKAEDPGLVYDASYQDYLLYGCSAGLTNIDPTFKCPRKIPPGYNLNYPSIAIPNLRRKVTVKRTVTNVGDDNSTTTYKFSSKPPHGFSVKAKPRVLTFNRIGQKKRFKIVIRARRHKMMMNASEKGQYQFGWFKWTDNYHVYIVYFGEHKGDKAIHEIEDHHHSYLQSVKESVEDAKSSLLYSYKHSINGFAAELTHDEASRLEKLKEVVSVFKSNPRKYKTHTTRSWEFVGLKDEEGDYRGGEGDYRRHSNDVNDQFHVGRKFLKKAKQGEGVIVGVIDNGVWPESRSFSDEGMGPIPKSWKGICQTGVAFNSSHCNRKIIGARYYARGYERYYGPFDAAANKDFLSPRDADGHGTHTSSTAVGRRVSGVSAFNGIAKGTASGGASLAHLAVYKACWAIPNADKNYGNTCFDEDLLAAFDDAIADGVHVISISIGTTVPQPYLKDGIAIGALHAVKRDIVVAASAGNEGPGAETLSNPAPWVITVGASSLDRYFIGRLELGDGYKYESDSLTTLKMDNFAPLVYAADVAVPSVSMNYAP
ncbi:unnamed protein product [Thlaspi arvense]|uniref:Uncharacterized protein n=1 Tax=Thlaspi arvense TaxID=13288 RepID=A0AAU9RRB9_THLAR|nr:unnamed protein product [Thlaspi arvense]